MIAALRYLQRRGWDVRELPSGLLVAPIGTTPWQAWFALAGPDLVVQVRAPHRVGPETWAGALEACNAWNAAARSTTAWLAGSDASASFVVEGRLPAVDEASQELVDAFVDGVLQGAAMFWRGRVRSRV